jgi:methylphosphotriester-DNA--protein-cysteine methyltransferase
MYFADYVINLRVRTSLNLLRDTEQNLTQVAMNCGFSTSAAFNRAFKKVTGMMPSEYRKKYQISPEAREAVAKNEKEIREELRKKGYQYNNQDHMQKVELDLLDLNPVSYKTSWNECVNIGSLNELSRANTQFHVLHLQEHLRFKYVRVWNVFSEKMMISDGRTRGNYNFDLINQTLDFMVAHHIKPFMDLGRRPDAAVRSEGDEIYYNEEYISFASRGLWEDLLASFAKEIVSRYGIEEVSTWIFELTRDFHEKETKIYEDPAYDFFDAWKFTYRTIREIIPGAQIGGISTVIESDREFAYKFYNRCVKENCIPDFVSFFMYSSAIRRKIGQEDAAQLIASGRSVE